MTPLFKYFGSKWRLAPYYGRPADGETVIEPFAGSASYSMYWLQKCWRGRIVLNDADPRVADLWNWLRVQTPASILSLPTALPEGTDFRGLGLEPSAVLFLSSWQRVGRSWTPTVSKWGTGDFGGLWSDRVRARVAEVVPLLAHLQPVTCLPYQDLDNTHGLWFVDPPYQCNAEKYCAAGKNLDFAALATWVRSRNGRSIVCEQDDADWLPFWELRRSSVQNSNATTTTARTHYSERVWDSRWPNGRQQVLF